MNYTSNYNLKKPAGSDYVNVSDLNDNMDTLDSTLYATSTQANQTAQEVANMTAYKVISEFVVASSGSVNINLSSVDWSKWQEVLIQIINPPDWSMTIGSDNVQKALHVSLNNSQPSAAVSSDLFCWSTFYGENFSPSGNYLAFFQFNLKPNGGPYMPISGDCQIRLFPAKTPSRKVRCYGEGPAMGCWGGSDSITYANITKLILEYGSSLNLTGATIRVLGVD